jgi:hypothetical protein
VLGPVQWYVNIVEQHAPYDAIFECGRAHSRTAACTLFSCDRSQIVHSEWHVAASSSLDDLRYGIQAQFDDPPQRKLAKMRSLGHDHISNTKRTACIQPRGLLGRLGGGGRRKKKKQCGTRDESSELCLLESRLLDVPDRTPTRTYDGTLESEPETHQRAIEERRCVQGATSKVALACHIT